MTTNRYGMTRRDIRAQEEEGLITLDEMNRNIREIDLKEKRKRDRWYECFAS